MPWASDLHVQVQVVQTYSCRVGRWPRNDYRLSRLTQRARGRRVHAVSCVAVERHGVCGGSGSVSGLPLCGLWVGAQQRHETAFSCGVWLWAGVSCKCLLRHTFDAAMPVCVCMYISDGIMMLQTYSESLTLLSRAPRLPVLSTGQYRQRLYSAVLAALPRG